MMMDIANGVAHAESSESPESTPQLTLMTLREPQLFEDRG
jgi:hypothetical protein